MITLLIDTSSADVSIAILKDTKILSSITKTILNNHHQPRYITHMTNTQKYKPQKQKQSKKSTLTIQ